MSDDELLLLLLKAAAAILKNDIVMMVCLACHKDTPLGSMTDLRLRAELTIALCDEIEAQTSRSPLSS